MGVGLLGCGEGGIVRGDIVGCWVVREFEFLVFDVFLFYMFIGCFCRLFK